MSANPAAQFDPAKLTAQERELAQLIVSTLNLEVGPDEIDPQARLYEEGLGLDSIDILEIARSVPEAEVSGWDDDDENNTRIFSSLRSLNEHVRKLQGK